MEKEICTIRIASNNCRRDSYTFYESGKIKRFCVQENLSSNITEWLDRSELSEQSKDRLIKHCPEKLKEKIMLILDYP